MRFRNFRRQSAQVSIDHAVLKFHDFSITQILREINFGNSRSAKSTFLTLLEAQNFDFLYIFALSEG